MPWEVTIVASEDQRKPLGTREEVIARVSAALPGVALQQPPVPPPQILAQMPEIVRESMLRPRLEADFETDEFVIQFFANATPTLYWIGAEVRGNGNPLPALAELCLPNGWLLIDASAKSLVDMSATSAPEWDRFRKWRDRAIGSVKNGGGAAI
jgi:hypothetical protein